MNMSDITIRSQTRGPWVQLLLGIVCMVMVSNLQYGWTLFVNPIDEAHGWGRAAIQVAFTIFILVQTWLVPLEGYLVDRFGPRPLAFSGGLFVLGAWAVNSFASSLPVLYAGAVLGGIGVGIVVSVCYGNALKWFSERRGLAVGLTAAGYGAGSALTIIPISWVIADYGYETAFFIFALLQGGVVMLASLFLRTPSMPQEGPSAPLKGSEIDAYSPIATLKTPVFWVMYVMFVLVAAGGLMAIAQLALLAADFGVADIPVNVLGLTLPALVLALSLDRITNGISRPFFGWVSDWMGRERTMFIAFMLEALSVCGLVLLADNPFLFVLLSGLVFFAWGEIFSLFPSLCTDLFGKRFATTNYGMLYTAKGVAALVVPVGSIWAAQWGWTSLLLTIAALDVVAALLALFVLMPLGKQLLRKSLA